MVLPIAETSAMSPAREQTDFGFQKVPFADKQALVDDVFRSVAQRYDLMNDLMSAGLHRAWKDILVTAVNPPTKGPLRRPDERPQRASALRDLAGGTGEVAFAVGSPGAGGTR